MRSIVVATLVLAAGPAFSDASTRPGGAQAPADRCDSQTVQTDNRYLDLSTLVGKPEAAVRLDCAMLPRNRDDPRLVDLRTADGIEIGIGKGGQIYSLIMPGLDGDLIPRQPPTAAFVDAVVQTVATNLAERRASPRGRATTAEERRGPGWHYHQAGAYQRGSLAGKPALYSPLLYDRIDRVRGVVETLNLALQAHPNPDAPPDRFLVFMRLEYLGEGVFELTQGWISNSKNRNTATSEATTALDYFNFPWAIFDAAMVPKRLVNANGQVIDVSASTWPPSRDETIRQPRWFAAFRDGSPEAPGFGIALAADPRTRLRVGTTRKQLVQMRLDRPDANRDAFGEILVVEAARSDVHLGRDDIVTSRSYLAFGRRHEVERRLGELSARSFVRAIALPPPTDERDIVRFCKGSSRRYQACPDAKRFDFALSRQACTPCLPLYEVSAGRPETYTYTTDPYADARSHDLAAAASSIGPVMGWMYGVGRATPPGFASKTLRSGNALGIKLDRTDEGSYGVLEAQDGVGTIP